METTQLSSKGQLVLPQRVRKIYGWGAGTVFKVSELPEGVLLSPVATPPVFARTQISEVYGMAVQRGRKTVSLAAMDAAIKAEAAKRK